MNKVSFFFIFLIGCRDERFTTLRNNLKGRGNEILLIAKLNLEIPARLCYNSFNIL